MQSSFWNTRTTPVEVSDPLSSVNLQLFSLAATGSLFAPISSGMSEIFSRMAWIQTSIPCSLSVATMYLRMPSRGRMEKQCSLAPLSCSV